MFLILQLQIQRASYLELIQDVDVYTQQCVAFMRPNGSVCVAIYGNGDYHPLLWQFK